MCAIVGVVLLMNRELAGILDTILCWLLSLPIIIYTVKYGWKSALVPAAAMLLLSFMVSMPSSTFYLFAALLVGLAYGQACNLGVSNGIKLVLVIVLTFFATLLTMVIFAGFFGYSPQEDLELLKMVLQALQLHVPGGIAKLAPMFSLLMVVLISVLQGITIHLLAFVLMTRLKLPVKPIKTVLDIRVPKAAGWICLLLWLLFLGTYVLKLESNTAAAITGCYLVMLVFTVSYGCLSVMSYFILSNHKKWIFILPVLAFVPYLQFILMLIGIADMIMDLRGRMKRGVMYGKTGKL